MSFVTGSTFLGGDDDDAVGTACTVERGGGSVFQNSGGSDVARVNRRDVTVVGHTIYYVERRRTAVERTDTTDTYGGVRTRLSAAVDNLHTGNLSGKGFRDFRRAFLLNVFCFHSLRRACIGTLADVTVTGDNDLLDYLAVLAHDDAQVLAGSHLFGSHTDETDDESLHRLGNFHLESSIVIRDSTLCGATGLNAGADHRLTVCIHYHTAHLLLGVQTDAQSGKKQKGKNLFHYVIFC